jgi:serine/threonine protein kinase
MSNSFNIDEESSDEDFEIFLKRIKETKISEPTIKKELVEKYLNDLGLQNFKLNTTDKIRKQVKNIIDATDTNFCGIFRYPKKPNGEINFNKLNLFQKNKSHHMIISFELIKDLSEEGFWNKIQLFRDKLGKEYIFRSAIKKKEMISEKEDAYLFRSFNENLKHMILYFLLKYFYPDKKYKIIPEIYYFGLLVNPVTEEKTFVIAMEKENLTLGDYFKSMPTNYLEMRKKIFVIYRALELLNDLGLNFKHGDLKYNNILLNDEYKPMIIDFGKSSLQLDDLIFDENDFSTKYENPYMNVTHDIMQLLCSLFIPKVPKIIMSEDSRKIEDYIIDVYQIFIFCKNKNNFILNAETMKKIIMYKYCALFIPYTKFYLGSRRGVDLNNLLKENPSITIIMRSDELAEELNLTDVEDEYIFSKYEKKYLKYKTKYLELKKNFL